MSFAPLNLRQVPTLGNIPYEPSEIDLGDDIEVDPKKELLSVELPDGSISINLGGLVNAPSGESSDHDANLAQHIGDMSLGGIADELIRLIEEDERRQSERLQDIAKGLDLLGIKLEEPKSEPNEEGLSVVRHPLLLEAVMKFQATASGELLPSDGPVKVRDDNEDDDAGETEANKLAKDMNHYLTTVATEYYPDTDRMLFSLGFGGEAYRKVYRDPLKRRPVVMTVDRKDLILSDGAVSIENCTRVTHRSRMPPSEIRRMQIAGAWLDVPIGQATFQQFNQVDDKLANISGVAPKTTLEPDDNERIVYECYCELDLPGFENEDGLKLPYRVTIEKDSKQILEIRRWWKEGDEMFRREEVFVEYVFVPAMPGLNIGLLHILGNGTRALTAAWRIALDNGMLANFPGGIMARVSGRQQTSNIRVSPGQVAPVDTDGGSIKDAFMPMPYRDVTPGFLGIAASVQETMQRVAGTTETATGEGRSDAPVGTTIALIEQATMVLSAVHKRALRAQGKELQLLRDLFKQDPESLYRWNDQPNLPDAQTVINALNNNSLVPAADPNTSSQMMRVQKAIAVKTLASQSPQLYDAVAVDKRVLKMVGISNIEGLFAKAPPPMPGPDPSKMISAQAQQTAAQAKLADVQLKAKTAEADTALKLKETQVKAVQAQTSALDSRADNANRAADREAQLHIEQLRLHREGLIHSDKMGLEHKKHQDNLGLEHARMANEPPSSTEGQRP